MLKVLVVDDESVVRRGIVLEWDLGLAGCVVVGKPPTGEGGVSRAVERYKFPNRSSPTSECLAWTGIEMMTERAARGCRAHVILLTAYSDFS